MFQQSIRNLTELKQKVQNLIVRITLQVMLQKQVAGLL